MNKSHISLESKDFHLLYEHKYLMKTRIAFLIRNNIISSNNNFIDISSSICEKVLLLRNLYIKSLMVEEELRKKLHIKICEKVNAIKFEEKCFLEDLLNELQNMSETAK